MHVFTNGNYGKIYWAFGMLAAFMTAFYMFRLYFLTFLGKFRGTHEQEHHLHESPSLMTLPLWVLAILSIIGGAIGIPEIFGNEHWLKEYLEPILEKSNLYHFYQNELSKNGELTLMALAVGIAILGIILAWVFYKNYNSAKNATGIAKIFEDKWYFDEAYNKAIEKPTLWKANLIDKYVEKGGIDKLVNGIGSFVQKASTKTRLIQSGMVGFYLFIMVAGAILLFTLLLFIK